MVWSSPVHQGNWRINGTAAVTHNYPVVVMSFDRPHYLEAVLKGLVAQLNCDLANRSISLFQDGAVNAISGEQRGDQKDVDACAQLFRQYFPDGNVLQSSTNLGTALNFDRAEKYVFETLGANAAIFFEDDLEITPHYVFSLDHLLMHALADERVGYVAVYGYHRTPLGEQRQAPGKLIPLQHNWGFGLTKRQWQKTREYTDAYLDVVSANDYRSRDAARVRELFASWKLGYPGSSQDIAKTLACCLTGAVKLNIQACLGKYLGATGVHMTKEMYEQLGYEATEMYPDPVAEFEELTSERYDTIFNLQMEWATAKRRQ